MKKLLIPLILMSVLNLLAVTLEDCLGFLEENHQIPQKLELLEESNQDITNIFRKEWYPKLSLNSSFSWSLNTMEIGTQAVEQDKTQLELSLSQPIFTGNTIFLQREVELLNNAIKQKSLAGASFQAKKLVYTLYFNILITEQKANINSLSLEHWLATADLVQLLQDSGKASNLDSLLVANLILTQEETLENLEQGKEEAIAWLNAFLQAEISGDESFLEPEDILISKNKIKRNELGVYSLRESSFGLQQRLNNTSYFPTINAFVKGTYGNPNYNLYANEWSENMEVGFTFKWSFWNWRQESDRNKLLDKQKRINSLEREEFLIKVNSDLIQTASKITQIENSLAIKEAKLEVSNEIVAIYYENYRSGKSDVLTYSEKEMEKQQLQESIELLSLEKMYLKYIYNLILGEI